MNSLARILLALVPAIALTFAVPLVNRVEPRVFGLPFLLVWILLWVAATPFFMLGIERLRRQA